MGESKNNSATGPSVFVIRAQMHAELCLTLADLFGYPSASHAESLASLPFLQQCRERAALARLRFDALLESHGMLRDGYEIVVDATTAMPQSPGHALRAECTRLFWTYPRLVKTLGRRWVARGVSSQGEHARVLDRYRELGLRNKPTVKAPADDLASELDYTSYVLFAEAEAWRGNDSESALDWNELFVSFVETHLGPMGLGVSQAIIAETKLDTMKFYALLLQAVTELGRQ